MSTLDKKINEAFPGFVVRKDLVKAVKGNAIVPSYVLEYLLGQYCATDDEDSIQSGIATVKEILRKHYVHRNEAGLIRSNIRERGRWKVIDTVAVALNEKTDSYEATFSNLGIKKVMVDPGTVKAHPKLLVNGVWCIADVEYEHDEDSRVSPWTISSLKPIQLANFDYEAYVEARSSFTTEEWIDTLMQSIGFNPEMFGRRSKLLQLTRLIPFVERNYNFIELGPKGTGKSHIYSEFSPHGILISGGEVTVPKLFVNNSNGRIGLVGFWDVVAFDEFAGRDKKANKALVDIMKNYMANKTFSRGIETLGAEASMVFVGNTKHNVPYMLKNTDLFEELPAQYYDSAFIDRIHTYLPGWEVDVIRGEMFTSGYGFIVDYLAEILRHLRSDDFSDRYKHLFDLSPDISTRDRDAINKTMSGLMKILFPAGGATDDEVEELLRYAMEGRKRVKDQLMRIDTTYPDVDFSFSTKDGAKIQVTTLEEDEYPSFYHQRAAQEENDQVIEQPEAGPAEGPTESSQLPTTAKPKPLEPGHLTFAENRKGVTYDDLFGPYLADATKVIVTDPYIRRFHQAKNIMELIETILRHKAPETSVSLRLITCPEPAPEYEQKQREFLNQIVDACAGSDIEFSWFFDETDTAHARHIVTDTGWKISLDRGLDIYQPVGGGGAFNLAGAMQERRAVKAFEVTYLKVDA